MCKETPQNTAKMYIKRVYFFGWRPRIWWSPPCKHDLHAIFKMVQHLWSTFNFDTFLVFSQGVSLRPFVESGYFNAQPTYKRICIYTHQSRSNQNTIISFFIDLFIFHHNELNQPALCHLNNSFTSISKS